MQAVVDRTTIAALATAAGTPCRSEPLARSAERAVEDHFAQGALEDRELVIVELLDEQLRGWGYGCLEDLFPGPPP
jgi:hypothetical protein